MLKKFLIILFFLIILATLSFALFSQQSIWVEGWKLEPYNESLKDRLLVRYSENFILDINKNLIIARGSSPINRLLSDKNKLAMENESIADAISNMIQGISSFQINNSNKFSDLIENSEIEQYIKDNISIIHTRIFTMENKLRTTITLPLFGSKGVINLIDTNKINAGKLYSPATLEGISVENNYTGLILIVSGLGFKPCIAPTIVDEAGNEIYGPSRTTAKEIKRGIVQYCNSFNTAKRAWRAGSNPLIIKAVAVNGTNVIVSDNDGLKIIKANQNKGFLEDIKVVFVL